ncbi:MAG: tRNA pseudouridine(55) synthase TruB [Firmicutes bacterium]|nr:tRNA pseudouridine(55) synthase TruB [Bacillota bacterium]
MSFNGFLVIDKPAGYSSHQVVAKVRKILNERRVGHTGTLDPMATGVLVVAVGFCTKLIPFLDEQKKVYQAKLVIGLTTDTQDLSGRVVSAQPETAVTQEMMRAALSNFTGELEQTPPMYSAVKVQGEPLYKLARAGKEIPRKKRKITIFRLEVVDNLRPVYGFQEGPYLRIECSRGTYIRTLCHELGAYLGCGGCMGDLVRLASGPFRLGKAVSLDELQKAMEQAEVASLLLSPAEALAHLPLVTLDQQSAKLVRHGGRVYLQSKDALQESELARGMTTDGRLLAILKYVGGEKPYWQPVRVLDQ